MFLFQGREAHSRSFAKAVSWRITGTIDTFVISAIVTGKATTAGLIAATEVLTKIVLFYFHERIWAVNAPRADNSSNNRGPLSPQSLVRIASSLRADMIFGNDTGRSYFAAALSLS